MPKKSNYNQHKNPNIICIMPSETDCQPTSPKRSKQEIPDEETSSQSIDLSFLDEIDVDAIVKYLNDDEETKSLNVNMQDENNKGSFEDGDIQDNTQIADMIEKNEVDCPKTDRVIKENLLSTIENHNNLNKLSPKDESENSGDSKVIPSLNSLNGDFKYHKTQVGMTFEPLNQHNKTKATENHRKLSSKCESKVKDIKEVTHDKSSKIDMMEHITDKKNTVLADTSDQDKNFRENLGKQLLQYLKKDCSVMSYIHSGKYSDIFKCKDSDSTHYAVKMIRNKYIGTTQQNQILKTIQVNIPDDNLLFVKIINDFCIPNKSCLVMDFYPKNLKEVLKESKKNFHIDKIQELGHQLVTAVTILLNKNIVHSDIQPSHILLDSTTSKLKVCGFDEAYFIHYNGPRPFGKPNCYRAPEILLGHSAGFSVDVWSIAVVLHEMATGIQLFGGCHDEDVLYKQICISGNVPYSMIRLSQYRDLFEYNRCVQKRKCLTHANGYGLKKETVLARTIHGAYYKHWVPNRNDTQRHMDLKKMGQFINLLDQMLINDPEHRPFIEIVNNNPFFYDFCSR